MIIIFLYSFFSPQREIFFESKTYFFEEYFQLKPIGIVLDNYTFLVDVFPSIGEFLLKINWFLLCKQCTNYGSILIYQNLLNNWWEIGLLCIQGIILPILRGQKNDFLRQTNSLVKNMFVRKCHDQQDYYTLMLFFMQIDWSIKDSWFCCIFRG